MLFIIDAQLPPGLAALLNGSGHQARHVCEIGMLGASDEEIRQFAQKTGSVIVTRDPGFAALSALAAGPQIVWIRLDDARTAQLRDRLGPVWPQIIQALDTGDRLVEVA